MSDASRAPHLVTGASGFLGRHLLHALAEAEPERPHLALVRDPDAWRALEWTDALPRVAPVTGEVTRPATFGDALPRLGGIFHLAAVVQHTRRGVEDLHETNVEGTLAMVRLAARHGCRLVMLSTSGTVGCFPDPHARADEKSPFCAERVGSWPYYASKIEAERRGRALAEELGVELVVIRPPVLLGPGDHRHRSTRNVWKAMNRRLPFVVRGGMHFADVRDAARAVAAAMAAPEARPVYHLPGFECGIEEFFARVEAASGVPRPPFRLPYSLAWGLARLLERLHLLPDPVVVEMAHHHWGARSLWADELGYAPRDPDETLRDTVAWLRENPPE